MLFEAGIGKTRNDSDDAISKRGDRFINVHWQRPAIRLRRRCNDYLPIPKIFFQKPRFFCCGARP